ncbi:MAG: DUF3617 domain-containing protein [Pseudomonadota bacterium]
MRHYPINFAIASFVLATSVHAAEISVKAGLWEITTTSNLINLASQIPPEQLENINVLAKEYGFEMPEIQNGAAKSNACITQEMANQKILPSNFQGQAGCTVNNAKRNGNDYRMEYVCKNEQLDGSGVAEATFTNSDTFTGHSTFNGSVQGNPVTEQANMNGRWVSADCGASKPIQ